MKRIALLLCVALALVTIGESAAAQSNQAGYGNLRMMVKKSARQYLMYQYGLRELTNTRAPLLETIDEFNLVFGRIRRGDAFSDATPPTDPKLTPYLEDIEQRWRRLEDIYTFQPYKLHLHKELLPLGERKDDPVLVRYVDRLAEELLGVIDELIVEFRGYCDETGSTACSDFLLDTGRQMLLTESMATDMLFAHLRIDPKKRANMLRVKADEFTATLRRMREADRYVENPPELAAPVIATIESYWDQMRVYVDRAIDGDADEINIDLMLRVEERMIDEIANLVGLVEA